MEFASPEVYDSLSVSDATTLQRSLRLSLTQQAFSKDIKFIAGADISLNRFSDVIYAGIVVLRYDTLAPVAYSLIKSRTTFPYVPGYLAFREVPALLQAYDNIKIRPDVVVVDGHGIAHPRRMGIAAHFGALIKQPTMGCAKKILYGHWQEPKRSKGSYVPIMIKEELLGYALRTKDAVKPVFISPGNYMLPEDTLKITLHCSIKHRLPEPTRKAHEFVNAFRKGLLKEGYHEIPKGELF